MRTYPLARFRNIGIMAHIDAGKTTTTERMLYYSGEVHRPGEVDSGSTVTDWMLQEKERGITITSAAITCYWRDNKINIIDTPGHVDFTVEVERCLRVLDGAIAVLCGVGGVEAQSETVWHQADRYKVPRLVYVNKLDRVGADFDRVVQMLRDKLGVHPVCLQLPLYDGDDFIGIVDLIEERSLYYDAVGSGKNYRVGDVSVGMRESVAFHREELLEVASLYDDELTEHYLETEDHSQLDKGLIRRGLRRGTLLGEISPVLCGSSYKNKGVQPLLDAVVDYLPSPLDIGFIEGREPSTNKVVVRESSDESPLSALAFKLLIDPYVGKLTFLRIYSGSLSVRDTVFNPRTGNKSRVGRLLVMQANRRENVSRAYAGEIVAGVGLRDFATGDTLCKADCPVVFESMNFPEPVVFVAIEPRTKSDEERLEHVLAQFAEEDPSFNVSTDTETGQRLIAGMGELHLEIIVERLYREFDVNVNVGKPQVAYKETVSLRGEGSGTFDRQVAAKNHFGHVVLSVEPLEQGAGFNFKSEVSSELIPLELISAIESGVRESLSNGVLAGNPLVDVDVAVIGGTYRELESTDLAFKVASTIAFRRALENAGAVLLEPIMDVEVTVHESYVGDVISDLNIRRGKIIGISERKQMKLISADVPLSEMFGYASSLRSLSQGRAVYSMEYKYYSSVPESITNIIVSKLTGNY